MRKVRIRCNQLRVCRSIGGIALTLVLFTTYAAICTAAPADLVEQFRKSAAADGRIALGEIAALKETYLADITIQTPRIGGDGSVAGTATFAGRDTAVLLQYVERSSGGMGHWLLAWRLPTQDLSELIPAMGAAAGQGVHMATPVVIFSRARLKIASASMSSVVRAFYQPIYGGGGFTLGVQDGVNLVTAVQVRAEILAGLQTLGANIDNLVLEGVVLKNFDKAAFRKAREQGRLTSAAVKDAELRARLSSGTLTGLPATFAMEDLALLVTGRPTAGVRFDLLVGNSRGQRRFDCRGLFLGAGSRRGGKSGIVILAKSADDRPWHDALGIQGLELHSAALELRSEARAGQPPRMLVGVKGDMKLASKLVKVAGGVTSQRGVPSAFFRGAVDSLGRDDLVAVANDLARAAHGGLDMQVVGAVLPDFELRNVKILYAPSGGSAELGVASGIGLKGQLHLFGRPAAQVDGLIDTSSRKPRTRLKATAAEFQIGPLKLHDSALDVLLAASTESHFRVRGGCGLLGSRVSASGDLKAERSAVRMAGRIANAFEADVVCATSLAQPDWQFSAGFKNDFANSFQKKVGDEILAWAKQAERDFARVNSDLEKAERDTQRIDADIAKARAQVRRDRATNEAALRRAQSDLNSINTAIAKMRDQVQRERGVHLGALRKAKQDLDRISGDINARRAAVKAQRVKDLAGVKAARDRAKRSYDRAESTYRKAVSTWKKAKGINKIKKGIDKDRKGIDRDAKKLAYNAKKKAYDIARGAINKVPVDADPQIVALFAAQKTAQAAVRVATAALRKIHGTAPIDSDPRVAGLFVGRDTARAAVSAAQKAFDLAHRTPVDADPRVAPLFAARDGALAALNAAQTAVNTTSDAVQWGAKVAAAAASAELLRVESARLSGDLSVFKQGGKLELQVAVRLLDEVQRLHLLVKTADLANGRLFQQAGKALIPDKKSNGPNGRAIANSPRPPSAGRSNRHAKGTGPVRMRTGERLAIERQSSKRPSRARRSAPKRSPSTPALSSQPPSPQAKAPQAKSLGSNAPRSSKVWLSDVRGLRRDLHQMNHGAGWVKYLRLTDLEQIAAARAFGRRRDNAARLQRILAKFEKLASNPDYAAIHGKASFTRVLATLRSEVSAGS